MALEWWNRTIYTHPWVWKVLWSSWEGAKGGLMVLTFRYGTTFDIVREQLPFVCFYFVKCSLEAISCEDTLLKWGKNFDNQDVVVSSFMVENSVVPFWIAIFPGSFFFLPAIAGSPLRSRDHTTPLGVGMIRYDRFIPHFVPFSLLSCSILVPTYVL